MSIMRTVAVVILGAVSTLTFCGTGHAGVIDSFTDHNRINLSASKYKRAVNSNSMTLANHAGSLTTYMVLPWGANCTSTTSDQTCEATSLPKCQQAHPDDAKNKWRPFDIFISHDSGKTYPGYPNNPDQSKVCLNTITLNAPTRPPLDPQLVFREATKLVPEGQWHPQPAGQAIVNKPVIFTVDTNRDQTFAPFTLLGYHVEVRAHITEYTWNYGDTAAQTVDWPGRDYDPNLGACSTTDCASYVNHAYRHPGAYAITLTLHWHADYRADGGPWQPVPGQITTNSAPRTIDLYNAHSELVAGN